MLSLSTKLLRSTTKLLLFSLAAHAAPQQQQQQAPAEEYSVVAADAATAPNNGQACNNAAALCSKPYNRITHLGAHNSAFLRDGATGNSLAGNQFKNASAALDAGLRLLQVQVHRSNGTLELCHTSCSLLDAGPLETWLAAVADWMGRNPNDVTLLLVNADNAPAADFTTLFEKAGLAKLAYKPPSASATGNWPTLASMISQGTRLVTFVTNLQASGSAPYLLPEFDYVFETAFTVTDLGGFNCTLDRPSSAGPAATALANNFLSLVNHFKYQTLSVSSNVIVPDVDRIDLVNSPATSADGNLGKHAQTCKTQWAAQPNFLLVDFWDRANPIAAADALNGLSGTTGRTVSAGGATSAAGGRRLRGGCALTAWAVGVAALSVGASLVS